MAEVDEAINQKIQDREVELLSQPGISAEEAHAMAADEAEHTLQEMQENVDNSLMLAMEAK